MRMVDVSARRGPNAYLPPALPTLREILARLRRGMFAPEGAAPIGGKARFAAIVGITVDLVVTLALLTWGWLPGASNLAGFGMGATAFLGARVLWPAGSRPAEGWQLVVAALALCLRGGAIATTLAYGLPPWLSLIHI